MRYEMKRDEAWVDTELRRFRELARQYLPV